MLRLVLVSLSNLKRNKDWSDVNVIQGKPWPQALVTLCKCIVYNLRVYILYTYITLRVTVA